MKRDMQKVPTLIKMPPTSEPIAYPGLERIQQRRILYYSDFDIDVNDWKTEQQAIQIFGKTLLKGLSECWIGMFNSVVTRHKPAHDSLVPGKSPWEVAVEYALLTLSSEKSIDIRTEELTNYLNFYGFDVTDAECFKPAVEMFLKEVAKAEHVIKNMREIEKKYNIDKREATYNHIKQLHKGCSYDILPMKKRRKTYTILNRAVTPLLLANEKLVESLLSSEENLDPAQVLEAQMEKMSIEDMMMPNLQVQRKPSKSVNVKRSYLEMHRLRSAPNDVFSVSALKAIFSYVDYESLKFPAPHFVVIGHFAAVVFEIAAPELKKLSDCVSLEMGEENVNIRVLKPFKKFYNEMIATALKYGIHNLHTVNPADFVDALAHSMKEVWALGLKRPAEAFYEVCKTEAGKESNRDVPLLFESIRHRMEELWEAQIIQRSNDFKRAKLESY